MAHCVAVGSWRIINLRDVTFVT